MPLTPEQLEVIGLTESLQIYGSVLARHGLIADASQQSMLWYACNGIVPLPEEKVEGLQLHMCGMNLGTRTYGWNGHAPILYALPYPSGLDMSSGEPLFDPGGRWLKSELEGCGIPLDKVFCTHAVRFAMQEGMKSYRQAHKAVSAALLRADALITNPRLIIASGADSLKAFFGRNAKIDNYVGQFHEWNGIPIMAVPSHLQFMFGHAGLDTFRSYLERARDAVVYDRFTLGRPRQRDYRICTTAKSIEDTCREIVQKADRGEVRILVFDTEFGNDVAREEHTYTLSVQISWEEGCAAYLGLYGEGGKPFMSDPDLKRSIEAMKVMFEHPAIQLGGHHLRVDVQRLSEMGIEVDEKLGTGWDTMLMHHLLFGDDDQGLEVLMRKACPEFGNYWKPLEDWLDENGRKYNLQFGYRNVPDEILIPYSIADADVTFRCLTWLFKQFERQDRRNLFEIYKSITAPTSLHIMDMERHGILVDNPRRGEIRAIYQPVYDDLLNQLRTRINWPEFNPGSKDQVLSLLFSECAYKDKKDNIPEGARVLKGLKPLFNTDKYPRDWVEIEKEGVGRLHTPSTKSEALSILYNDYGPKEGEPKDKNVEIKLLRQISILGKFLRDYLHPMEDNEFGVPADGKGIHNNIWEDGRVRTHLWQTSETHRYRSSKPNLQTSPKRQEEAAFEVFIDYHFGCTKYEYEKRCADPDGSDDTDYVQPENWIPPEQRLNIPSYKSCLMASPDHYLIEADFATAELCVLAYASGDETLIQIVDQGRDLHSEMAVKAFKLAEWETKLFDAIAALESGDPGPYKKWAKAFKNVHGTLRIAAKTVNFG